MAADETTSPAPVTSLLQRAAAGDTGATNELLSVVYAQLKAIAKHRMSNEAPGHTLQATALVHEAFLRLIGARNVPWQNRAHFYATAAEAMRRVLFDHARSRKRQKRGGNLRKLPLNVAELAALHDSEQILALESAVCRLENQNPDAAQIVRLRFYGGLSVDQTAEIIGISPRTVDRRWKFARAWLFKTLGEQDEIELDDR